VLFLIASGPAYASPRYQSILRCEFFTHHQVNGGNVPADFPSLPSLAGAAAIVYAVNDI
jgi:hypothetical protein